MKLSIIGAGNVGRSLAQGWSRVGHAIVFGVKSPADQKHVPIASIIPGASVKTVREAVEDAEVVVLAVPWDAAAAACAACGDFAGKVLIDATNPLRFSSGVLELDVDFETSGGEQIAAMVKTARVVKTMNQVGFAVMATADRYPIRPIMFAASDDAAAKRTVLTLVQELGFEARDAGPLKSARLLESLAMLWIDQVVVYGASSDRAFAFVAPTPPTRAQTSDIARSSPG